MKIKLMTLAISALLASASAQAANFSVGQVLGVDTQRADVFSILMEGRPPQKPDCGVVAWRHTRPTQEQNQHAKEYVEGVKAIFEEHKEAIQAAKVALMQELMAHPISKEGAAAKGQALGMEAGPVMAAMFSAQIDIINLLSVDQRNVFNGVLRRCAQRQRH